MAKGFETPGNPLALGRGLEEDARRRLPAQCLGEALRLGADPARDQLASLRQDANLALPLVHVDAQYDP